MMSPKIRGISRRFPTYALSWRYPDHREPVIGVIDIEAREPGYFNGEHVRVLTLVALRMAAGIENAQLYTRTTKQARILLLSTKLRGN